MTATQVIIDEGIEGPARDPYSWCELTVIRDGIFVTRREGGLGYLRLTMGGTAPGSREPRTYKAHCYDDEAELDKLFEAFVGMTPYHVLRAYYRSQEICSTCGRRTASESCNGYPGETLELCVVCGNPKASHFNRSALVRA